MKIEISQRLKDIYLKQHKNFDYEINYVLDSLDPQSFIECFRMVESFEIDGSKTEIDLGEDVAKRIVSDLDEDSLNEKTVALLLWIGAAFPEV